MIYILLPIFLGVCVFMVCTVCWMEQSCIFHEFSRIFRTWMHSINNYSRRFRLPRHSLFVVSKKYTWAIIIIMIKLPTTFYHDKILQHLPFFFSLFHRYIYTNQLNLATVQFGMISLSLCIFSLGLSVGVVIAVGMLLFFQVHYLCWNLFQYLIIHLRMLIGHFIELLFVSFKFTMYQNSTT